MDPPEDGITCGLSYDVIWKETDTILEERMKIYFPYFSSLDHLSKTESGLGVRGGDFIVNCTW